MPRVAKHRGFDHSPMPLERRPWPPHAEVACCIVEASNSSSHCFVPDLRLARPYARRITRRGRSVCWSRARPAASRVLSRMLTQDLQARLGQSIVVDNRRAA